VYSLLRTAEELGIRKPVKPEYGGGNKEFVYDDQDFFIGTENATSFLTSQERQSIVRHMLFSLQAHQGETLGNIKFNEGQAIGMFPKVRSPNEVPSEVC
jgi:anoctamin-8